MNRTNRRAHLAPILAAATLFYALSQAPAFAQSPRERQLEARDHVNQGNFMMGQNHFSEAIDEYKKALEIDPTNSVAKDNIVTCHINWGNYYVRLRKYPEAIKEYQTCLILNPYNAKAMNNIKVVKATMARDGAAAQARADQSQGKGEGDKGSAQVKAGGAAAAPKKEQPSAVILTPGIKSSAGSGSESAESPTPTASYGEGNEGQPAAKIITPGAEGASQQAPPRPVAPPARPANTGPAPAAGTAAGSLEDQLSAVEIKIYGHKQPDMPVFKRLEKLETDSAGSVRTGTIKERIDFLRKNYGL